MAVSATQLLARMADMEKQDIDRHMKALIYGPSGAGKSTLAMWLAQELRSENGRIAYIDSAEGWVSLDNTPVLKSHTTRLPFTEYGELPALAEAIKRKVKGFAEIEVVVVDELDPIADDVLVQVVRERHGTPAGQQLPEIEGKDYRPMGDLIRIAINAFEKAGVHLILVAHDNKRKDHRNVEITEPGITPKLKKTIMGLMHVVGYAQAEIKGSQTAPEYSRTVQSLPTSLVEAKTRVGALRTKVKMSHEEFISALSEWVSPTGEMAEDLAAPEVDEDLQEDELPTDGIPVADNPAADDDDAPVYSGD
jgi:energy-coupling factor transporter ATP-binding protein EcfA2